MDKLLTSGQLDQRISIFKIEHTKNAIGEAVNQEVYVASVYAQREDVSGSESLEDGTIIALQVRRYYLRYRSGVDTTMYVRDGENDYKINYIGVHGRNQFIELKCSKRE